MTAEPEPTFDEVPAEPANLPHEPAVGAGGHRQPDEIGRDIGVVMDLSSELDARVTDGGSLAEIRKYWGRRLELATAEHHLWLEMMDAVKASASHSPWLEDAAGYAVAMTRREESEAVAMIAKYSKHGAPRDVPTV